jgi:hypothetical protein
MLIVVPIVFNVAFFELGRAFEYPAILRRKPDEILRRFAAGGAGLLLRWHLLFISALAMVPLAVPLALVLAYDAGSVLTTLTIVVGVVAGVVQGLGLSRWVFAVPELARRYVAADESDDAATRGSIEIAFAVLHRYLGVGVGKNIWVTWPPAPGRSWCRSRSCRARSCRAGRRSPASSSASRY